MAVSTKIKFWNPALSPQVANGVGALSYGAPPPASPAGTLAVNPVAWVAGAPVIMPSRRTPSYVTDGRPSVPPHSFVKYVRW